MKPGSRYYFFPQGVVFCLAILLGLQGTAGAAPLKNKPKQGKTAQRHSGKKPSKATQGSPLPPETRPATPDTAPTKPLKKPKPLSPAQITQEDPLVPLDQLVVKQQVTLAPYVPLVQTIDVAVDYGRLAMNLWTPQERRYAGSLSILLRKNIQLSGALGYSQLAPASVSSNQSTYTVAGKYGSLGLAYFTKYDRYNNLYAGLRYSRSYFKNSTVPASATEKVISKALTASWWELILGSEHQLFNNLGLYAGFVLHLKGLGSFEPFAPATNYMVPGYGRSVKAAVPSITLYIQYKISLLEQQISFSAPLAR